MWNSFATASTYCPDKTASGVTVQVLVPGLKRYEERAPK